jgi:hypothetical protein
MRVRGLQSNAGAYIAKLREHADISRKHTEPMLEPALDQRWISIGATHLQQGFMCVTRGIAQPTTF